VGLLATQLQSLPTEELDALSSLVGDIRSSYTGGDTSGRGFVGTESLRNGGARAVAVLPLWARRQRLGTLIFAHSRPLRLTGDDIEPLEMLADTTAAFLLDHSSGRQERGFDPDSGSPSPDQRNRLSRSA
jgi:GAF domain-containing protein